VWLSFSFLRPSGLGIKTCLFITRNHQLNVTLDLWACSKAATLTNVLVPFKSTQPAVVDEKGEGCGAVGVADSLRLSREGI